MFRKLSIAAIVATLGANASVALASNEAADVASTQSTCAEDLDGSGIIDFGDMLILVSNWGAAQTAGSAALQGDIDESGYVDTGDLLRLVAMYNQKCESE